MTPPLARLSNCRVFLLRTATRLGLVACASLGLSACLFPVFELEESSAPRQLAYAGRETAPSRARLRVAPQPSAAERPAARSKKPGASVLAPYVPEPEHAPAPLPDTVSECHRALHRAGVRFEALLSQDAPGVRWPVRLVGPVSGVQFEPLDATAVYTVLDCRLAVALRSWAGELRVVGVRRVQYTRCTGRVRASAATAG